jgi:hypothetical protein
VKERLAKLRATIAKAQQSPGVLAVAERQEVERFRQQHQEELAKGADPSIGAQYFLLKRRLAALEWEAEQP